MIKISRGISIAACAVALATFSAPRAASAFCGFYVGGAGSELYNNATMVVMMREGTRTVLSMQNNYQGPTKDFAMVVPVPVVLQKTNVKTLPRAIFKRVDKLAAPRLVEYWEKDPCEPELQYETKSADSSAVPENAPGGALGVKVEAKFAVGEYQIVILSAKNSTGLEKWLVAEKYSIPAGAAKYLNPYVQSGSKFFVAKVDATKVKFENGMAMLSPLRVHYDSAEFSLPIRLGMMNSKGTQDLIVHLLARNQRYEVANYKNVTIPTNLAVTNSVRKRFGEFYASLFDTTLAKNPGSVVTEYAWNANSCDPCPEPALTPSELATFGADVLPGEKTDLHSFVLTRLHARYSKDGIKDDLVFKKAAPIVGGREHVVGKQGQVEYGSKPGSVNNFQGRYIIRHKWTKPVACAKPNYGRWGGPPRNAGGARPVQPAMDLAFAPRGGIVLANMVQQDIPELAVKAAGKPAEPTRAAPAPRTAPVTRKHPGSYPAQKKERSHMKCSCASGSRDGGAGVLMIGLAVALAIGRRRRTM